MTPGHLVLPKVSSYATVPHGSNDLFTSLEYILTHLSLGALTSKYDFLTLVVETTELRHSYDGSISSQTTLTCYSLPKMKMIAPQSICGSTNVVSFCQRNNVPREDIKSF